MPRGENRTQKILASVLDGITVESATPPGQGADLVARDIDGREIRFQVKWAGEGWPQDVRRVASDVEGPWPRNLILLARHLSPGAIEWLRERGANWADESGQAQILGPNAMIVFRDSSSPGRRRGETFPLSWPDSALAIAELILAQRDQPLRIARLAAESDWSPAQVAKVLKTFDRQGWTVKRGPERGPTSQRTLADADGLLAAWSDELAGSHRETRLAHRATRDPMALLRDGLLPALRHVSGWAVSGWAALELAAPYASTTPNLHIYVADTDFATPLKEAIRQAGLREVDEGGRVIFWAADARLFKLDRQVDGIPVVSAPRLFADLSSFGGRGQDAADHVKAELIDPLHESENGQAIRG